MRTSILAALATALLGVGAAHADPILTNGDFETGTFAGWAASGTLGIFDSAFVDLNSGATGSTGTGLFTVFGSANTGSTGVISQSIATTAGVAYNLSFQYGTYGPTHASQGIHVTAGDLNITVTSATAINALTNALKSYTFGFTATGSSTTISFADVSGTTVGVDGVLDNVSVPEPAGLALLSLGAIGTGLLRRRRTV